MIKSKDRGSSSRMGALLMVLVLFVTLWNGALLPVKAATTTVSELTVTPSYISRNGTATITFTFVGESTDLAGEYTNVAISDSSSWKKTSKTILYISSLDAATKSYQAVLSNLQYTGSSSGTFDEALAFSFQGPTSTPSFGLSIGRDFFKKADKDDPDKDPVPPTEVKPNILIENIILYDKDDKEIHEVTKDTPPFRVTILYQDTAVERDDMYDLLDDSMQVFWDSDSSLGFDREQNTVGKLTTRPATSDGIPRFRIDFDNVTYNEKGQEIHFKVRYRLGDSTVVAGPDKVRITAAIIPEEKKKEEEEEKISPQKPHIIVSDYSYGDNQIQAGSEFTLNLHFKNTSNEIPLENIVMAISPPEDLSIASSSNTEYITDLGAGASKQHSIDLKAKPNASVGSAEVSITFTYEYVDTINKKREEGTFTEKIAVPITQIDRFAVDPITEIPEQIFVNETFDLMVKFINRGKSPTYNISVTSTGNLEIVSTSEHFGNLEPGKSGDVQIDITPHEFGNLAGEILIQYEDEMANQKEIKVPYEVYIMELWDPGEFEENPNPNPENEKPEPTAMSTTAIVFLSLGALFVSVPTVLYFAKKAKLKESEDFYEDF